MSSSSVTAVKSDPRRYGQNTRIRRVRRDGPGDPELLTVRASAAAGGGGRRRRRRRARPRCATSSVRGPRSHGARRRRPAAAARRARQAGGRGRQSGRRVVRLLDGDPVIDGRRRSRPPPWPRPRCRSRSCPASRCSAASRAYAGAADRRQGPRGARRRPDDPASTGPPHTARGSPSCCSARPTAPATWPALLDAGRSPATPVASPAPARPSSSAPSPHRWPSRRGRKAAKQAGPGVVVVGEAVAPARAAVLVRDQAAVRLAGPGAAHQGAGRLDDRPAAPSTARSRRRSRRSPSSRRAPRSRWSARSRAWSPAATSGSPSPGQRGQGGAGEVRGVRAGRPRLLRPQGRRGRRADGGGAARVRHQARPGAERRAVGARPARGLAAVRRRSSTRSTGSSCRAPTSRPTPWSPACTTSAGRSTTSPRTARCGPRRRPRRRVRRSSPAASTRSLFTSTSTVRNLVGIAGKPHAVDRRRVHRSGHGQDRRGARPARRRPAPRRRRRRRWSRRWPSSAPRCGRRPPRRASRCCGRASARAGDAAQGQVGDRGLPGRVGPGGCGRRRRCGGWSPSDPAAPGRARAAAVRQGGR